MYPLSLTEICALLRAHQVVLVVVLLQIMSSYLVHCDLLNLSVL